MGTRFLTYLQSPLAGAPFDRPEPVTVELSPSEIRPGPADKLISVWDAIKGKYPNTPGAHAYEPFGGRPWGGAVHRPPVPGPDGHFDHLVPATREFAAASVYASVRLVLATWEKYFAETGSGSVHWHHRKQEGVDERLEVNPWSLDNGARAGYGFIEFGTGLQGEQFNHTGPLWNNPDVIAHELGHSIVFGAIGFPGNMSAQTEWYSTDNKRQNRDYLAFHESAGDLVSIVSCMRHDKVVDHLLERSAGNLHADNVVNTIGELGKRSAIRHANNKRKLAEFDSVEPDKLIPHELSLVLTGAIYSVFVDAYEEASKKEPGRQAVQQARDWLGRALAKAWSGLSPDGMTFLKVRDALISADASLGGAMGASLEKRFKSRGIG